MDMSGYNNRMAMYGVPCTSIEIKLDNLVFSTQLTMTDWQQLQTVLAVQELCLERCL